MFDFTSRKELLRAIDVRLETLTQNLSTSCGRAVAAGYDHDIVADLQLFAERFGAKVKNSSFISSYYFIFC
ncbi:hypothetical protein HanPI659440_Chr09g0360631 [Helianthus annuus]|nr:hypothetical protein HanPI659440_Chr09g0360631 [Helianthus annuus]